ncbi:MAG TPA: hypothetical protein DCQ97_03795 [Chitinophagaceae bacterium]|nr:hypothetical protein [Chitinophagaceae bacterium]
MRCALFTATLFLLSTTLCVAQKGFPEPGKIDKADLQMTDCDFDKGAEAVKLIDWGKVTYAYILRNLSGFGTVYERRVRIKVLKEKGLSKANVVIPYMSYSDYEEITKMEAWTYNLDDAGNVKTTKVSKSSIYKKSINAGISEMIIAFPEVKVGSVIEYAYTMERGPALHINDWNFQDNIPVKYSEYEVSIPSFLHFKVNPMVTDPMQTRSEEARGAGELNPSTGVRETTIKKFYSMQNLVALRDEPYMGSMNDYRQRIEFLLTQVEVYNNDIVDLQTSWTQVVEGLKKSEYFGQQLEKQLPRTIDLFEQWKAIPDPLARMKTVFQYVKEHMTWDDQETIVSYDGVEKAYAAKTGNSADINLLLINFLNQVKVKADPILFSTRKNGLVNTMYPGMDQFNMVMAHVAIGNRYYILDATDKSGSHLLIPEEVVNTNGFLVQGESGKWLEVLDDKNKYKIFSAVHAEIDMNGKMTGEVTVNSSGYSKKERCKAWAKNKDEFKKQYFMQGAVPISLEELEVNNVYADSLPLEQKAKFSSVLNRSGEYTYFPVNLFAGLDKNPFIAEKRVSDIEYGFLQDFILVGNYNIPDGYSFDALPENISLLMPDKSIVFNRFINASGNVLNVRMTLEFKNSYYPVADYPEFREYYKKLSAALDEQIIMKKK